MKIPRTSFKVVINGPVAKAGSILYLLSSNGISVPNTPAKRITVKRDRLTTIPKVGPSKTYAIP